MLVERVFASNSRLASAPIDNGKQCTTDFSVSRTRGRATSYREWLSVPQLVQPLLEKPPLGLLPREVEGALVRGTSFSSSPQSAAEIGPRRVRQMVVDKIPATQ